jgi:ubiquinone/menaquinone biosynthesis C-methylase UbiE
MSETQLEIEDMTQETLKDEVKSYWNASPCGTQFSDQSKYSREYFDEVEEYKYSIEPHIFSFAQFTRFHGKKVLEVGVGAGSDFIQWARAGAIASGIDLTEEGINHVRRRLEVYGLKADQLVMGDCENLPFEDNSFDLVYSSGVIHHTPDTERALEEIIRVCKPGGTCKVMVYHRHSLLAFSFWVRKALLKGRPWKSFAWCLAHYMESPGTKAYTRREIRAMLRKRNIKNYRVWSVLTYYDKLGRFNKAFRAIAHALAVLLGYDNVGWFLNFEFQKPGGKY